MKILRFWRLQLSGYLWPTQEVRMEERINYRRKLFGVERLAITQPSLIFEVSVLIDNWCLSKFIDCSGRANSNYIFNDNQTHVSLKGFALSLEMTDPQQTLMFTPCLSDCLHTSSGWNFIQGRHICNFMMSDPGWIPWPKLGTHMECLYYRPPILIELYLPHRFSTYFGEHLFANSKFMRRLCFPSDGGWSKQKIEKTKWRT
jgi:hypothetical protein